MTKAIKKLLGRKALTFIGFFYTITVTFLLVSPSRNIPKISLMPSMDKLGHVVLFLVLGFIWQSVFFVRGKRGRKISLIILGVISLYGIIIEVLQGLVFESRTADLWDVIANTIGILIGFSIFHKIKGLFVMKS